MIILSACGTESIVINHEDSEKIKVFSLSEGKGVEITNKDDIEYISNFFTDVNFVRDFSVRGGEGIIYEFAEGYVITWYDENDSAIYNITLLDGRRIYYNNYFYDLGDPKQVIDIDFFSSLFSPEDTGVYSFIATVIEIGENAILVEPAKDEFELNISDRIWVSSIDTDLGAEVGSRVRITYYSSVMEGYPAGIDAEHCELVD